LSSSRLVARALVAAIALQLSVAGIVVASGGRSAEAAAAPLERAEILPTVGFVERPVLAVAGAGEPVELAAAPPTTAPPVPTSAPPTTAAPPPTTAPPTTTTTPPPPPTTSPAPPAPAPPTTATPAPSTQTSAAGSWRDADCEVATLVWFNEARASAGRAPLGDDPAVDHVAFRWSDHLAATGDLQHNPRYADEIFAARPEAMTAGEVVGRGSDPRPVFDEFMRSPAHRDVILGSAFTRATVGCVRDAGGQVWIVANAWG